MTGVKWQLCKDGLQQMRDGDKVIQYGEHSRQNSNKQQRISIISKDATFEFFR